MFASVASLVKEEVLKRKFSPDSFEYIVMDDYAIIGLTQEGPEIKAFAA